MLLCCAGRCMLKRKACRALPVVYLVLVVAVKASLPRAVTYHYKQGRKRAKEDLAVHTEKLQHPAIQRKALSPLFFLRDSIPPAPTLCTLTLYLCLGDVEMSI